MRFKDFYNEPVKEAVEDDKTQEALQTLEDEAEKLLQDFTKLMVKFENNSRVTKSLAAIQQSGQKNIGGIDKRISKNISSAVAGLSLPLRGRDNGMKSRLDTLKFMLEDIERSFG